MAVRGIFASDSGIVGNPKGDFAAALLTEVPTGTAPLFALSSGMPSRNATDVVVNWFEENHISGRTTASAGGNSAVTTIPVTDASSYPSSGIILLEEATGEMVFVTAISGNNLTVIRGFAGTTAAAFNTGDGLQRIGNAQEEGSAKPDAITNVGEPIYNYCQIFRNTWNVTGTSEAVDYYTGSQVAKTQRDAALFHGEDIERSMWFGRRVIGVKNGNPFRMMHGLDALITENVTAAGGTTNWTQLDAFLQNIFARNIKGKPNERIAFCGNTALSVINQIARLNSTTYIEPDQTEFGINVHRWTTPYGSVSLMTHPMFVESPLWTKDLRVLHPGAFESRWLRKTHMDAYDKDGSRAGVDADYGVYTSELTVEYHVQRTGGRLTGLTAGAAG